MHFAGHELAELQGGAAGRVFFEAVMPLDDLDVGAAGMVLQGPGRDLGELHRQVHGQAHAGRPEQRNVPGGLAQLGLLIGFQPGGGQDERQPEPLASLHDGGRALRRGEIDHHLRPARQGVGNRHAYRADAGQSARVGSQLGVAGRFERGSDLELGVGVSQGHEPLAHAAGRSVNGNVNARHARLVSRPQEEVACRRPARAAAGLSYRAEWL